MQEKGRKKNQEKRIILAFLREETGILVCSPSRGQ